MPLPSMFNTNPGHYAKAFKVLCDRAAKFKRYSDWVDGVFSEAVVDKLQVTLDGQEELQVLGVGSGSGEMDCYMLEKLSRFPCINNRVVDPSQDLISKYKELVQSKAHQLHGVKCDFRQQTIEQYQKAGDLTKFHFISAVHSMYYIQNSSFEYMYNCLIPGGAMLVIISSDNSGWYRCRTRIPSLVERVDHFSHSTSADIRRSLESRGIPFTQYHHPVELDITQCFDQASEEGNLLLDFITDVVDFRETAPEDLQRSIMEYLGSSECSEKKNGATFLSADWDAIVILK